MLENDNDEGGKGGAECGESAAFGEMFKEEQSLSILSLRNLRNEQASSAGELQVGRQGGILRDRRESRADHSFLG